MPTFTSFAFGCRVNQAEKETLDRQLISRGFTWSDKSPDFYIINSCAVTQKAEREVRQKIYQMRRKFPKTKIIVTGCSATKWIKEKRLIREVNQLVDNVNKEFLADLLYNGFIGSNRHPGVPIGILNRDDRIQLEALKHNEILSAGPKTGLQNDTVIHNKFLNSGRLLVKIQDGCHRFCTYCIVPYLRGKPKSERIENIIKKINMSSWSKAGIRIREAIGSRRNQDKRTRFYRPDLIFQSGLQNDNVVQEVILTAINTESFGKDTGETLTGLLKEILDKTQIPRISFGSINPWSITPEFIKFYKKYLPTGRLVKFFHVPVQSGSDKILKLMKRGYASAEIFDKLIKLAQLPACAGRDKSVLIGTDIIVGFPGETEEDFNQTYEFLKKSPISKFHIFRYSPREYTAAYYMGKNLTSVDEATKVKRAKKLEELGRLKYRKFLESLVGQTFPALFLEKRIGDYQEALLNNNVPVFLRNGKNIKGKIVPVNIKHFSLDKMRLVI